MNRSSALGLVLLALCLPVGAEERADVMAPDRVYHAYVACESEDEVALVRFDGDGLEVSERIVVGSFPAEIEGPHGVALAAAGDSWFVSLAHGRPYGSVQKYSTLDNAWLGETVVGMFAATLAVSASTELLFVANFDLHGDPRPGTVSVVEALTMTEVAEIETGPRPHGGAFDATGMLHYSVTAAGGELVEIDTASFSPSRRLQLAPDGAALKLMWVTAPTSSGRIYVASSAGSVFEIEQEGFFVSRRFDAEASDPYNLAVSEPLGLLVVTYRNAGAVGFWDLSSGVEIARVAASRRLPHGVAITDDGLFSWVTVEGVGGEPGTVEIYDNRALRRVAAVDVGKQAGGIAAWPGPRRPGH